MVTDERWNLVKTTFQNALELPETERMAYIETACKDDVALRREVESLLAMDPSEVDFLERPPHRLLQDDPLESWQGTIIGPYRLVEEIGHGGLGTVYLSERDDDEFEHRVAIKILKRGMDTDEIVRRFRMERQILANLDHTHITKLLDGGVTPDGRPYFIMEYVAGQPITDYCHENKLTIEERLRLFQKVCAAVAFAHRNLVVHRDLKPSNILVTEQGEPRLLDFGIAKLLKPDASEAITTMGGIPLMTPEYASPEQVSGGTITTATDVYSLGVVLFELLAAQRPYQVNRHDLDETRRVICDVTPPQPSSLFATISRKSRSHRHALRGDLDTIVLMALRKEPGRRYSSVEQFEEDIDRHLNQHPVRARADSFLYRAKKFARRNMVAIAVAAAFLLMILGFAATMTLQQQQTAQERDRAERERDRAERITEFLEGLFDGADPYENNGVPPTVDELLETGIERLRGDESLPPDVRANVLFTLSKITMRTGKIETARSLLNEAIPLYLEEPGGGNLYRYANSLNLLGLILQTQGNYKEAEELFRESLAVEFAHERRVPTTINTSMNLGRVLVELDKFAEAEEAYLTAKVLFESNGLTAEPSHSEVLKNLAGLYQRQGKYEEAEPVYLDLLRLWSGETRPEVATTHNDLGELYRKTGRFDEAIQQYSESLNLNEQIHGPDSPHMGATLINMSLTFKELKRFDEAVDTLRNAKRIFEHSLGSNHPYVALAMIQEAQLNLERSLPCPESTQDALAIMNSSFPLGHSQRNQAERVMGQCLAVQGKYEDAEPHFLAAYEHGEVSGDCGNVTYIRTLEAIAGFYKSRGQEEAAAIYREECP